MKISKGLRWGSWDGTKTTVRPIEELKDDHLANVILWVKDHPNAYEPWVLFALEEEAEERKLTQEFLDGAPYPFKGPDGKWKQTDPVTCNVESFV